MYLEYSSMFKLAIYSHFFKIENPTPRITQLVLSFCAKYISYEFTRAPGQSKVIRTPGKVYATRAKDNSEFRFHIGQLPAFLSMLEYNHISPEMYDTVKIDLYTPKPIKLKMLPKWKLRDYQEEIVDFITEDLVDDNRSRLVSLATGLGKGISSLAAVNIYQTRTLITILPTYSEKWGIEICDVFGTKATDTMIVAGSDQLKSLIRMAKDNEITQKFIIISIKTLQNFYKAYELDPLSMEAEGYGCNPEELCGLLQIGTMVIDETHQHFHAVFKMLLYTHVPRLVALSATLMSDNPTIDKIQHLVFPKEIRFDKVKMDKYIKVYAVGYNFADIKRYHIRTSEYGSNNYSHNAFEKSILRNPVLLANYLNFIGYLIKTFYIQHYTEGDKLAVFASSVAMCTKITEYIKKQYPTKDVRRYVEQDEYRNVIDAEIRVTTVLSAGTAVDIPNLRVVIMTNCILSTISNIQSLGRLRKLPDRDVKFVYSYSNQLHKQINTHRKRKDIFADRVASIKEFQSPVMV